MFSNLESQTLLQISEGVNIDVEILKENRRTTTYINEKICAPNRKTEDCFHLLKMTS